MKEKVKFDQCMMMYKVTHKYYPEWLLNVPHVTQINEFVARQRVKIENGARSLF